MKKKSIHMIKPGRMITPSGRIEAYCAVLDVWLTRTTVNKSEATCKNCRAFMRVEKKGKK